jgi:hypothetical protein
MKGQTVDVVIVGDTLEVNRTADAILGSLQHAGVLFIFFVHSQEEQRKV